jgi:hypothetical protein
LAVTAKTHTLPKGGAMIRTPEEQAAEQAAWDFYIERRKAMAEE